MKKDWETNIAKNSKFNKILGLEREKARKGLENLADFAFYYSCYFGTFFMVGSWPWKVLLAFTFVSSICARLWALGFDTSISIGREETLTRGCLGPFLPFFLMRNSWLFFFTFAKLKAFFSFILYKSELLQIGTILVVVVVVDFCEICGPLEGLVYLYSFAEFGILVSLAIFVSLFLS